MSDGSPFDLVVTCLTTNLFFNRKLGEGAFGTVYGGEGYINSAWIGVAVKTLKVGSNSAQKVCCISRLLQR